MTAACEGSRKLHGDATLSAPQRHRRVEAFANDAVSKAAEPIERALRIYKKKIDELRAVTSAPMIELSDAAAIEIRTQLAGLPQAQRMAAIFRSIAKGSDRIVAALLGAGVDRFLSEGIVNDLELETIRNEWAKARHADECALLSQYESDSAHLARTAEIMRGYPSKCSGPSVVPPPLVAPGPGHRPQIFGYNH